MFSRHFYFYCVLWESHDLYFYQIKSSVFGKNCFRKSKFFEIIFAMKSFLFTKNWNLWQPFFGVYICFETEIYIERRLHFVTCLHIVQVKKTVWKKTCILTRLIKDFTKKLWIKFCTELKKTENSNKIPMNVMINLDFLCYFDYNQNKLYWVKWWRKLTFMRSMIYFTVNILHLLCWHCQLDNNRNPNQSIHFYGKSWPSSYSSSFKTPTFGWASANWTLL